MPEDRYPEMTENYKWFIDNLESLWAQYGHKWLAIKDKKIIGVYDTFAEGVEVTEKTEKRGTFNVQECMPDKDYLTWYYDPFTHVFAPIKSDEKCVFKTTVRTPSHQKPLVLHASSLAEYLSRTETE